MSRNFEYCTMADVLTSLLSSLVRVGAAVSLGEGGRLRLRAPPGAIDDDLRQAVTAHRDALVEHLRRSMLPRDLDTVTVACLEYGPSRGTTVFCFHGFQGTVGFYRPLAGVLSAAADVYGIQAVGVDLRREGLRSFYAMADYYAAQIALLSCKRILFVGWCIGAPLAIETARRLRLYNRAVETVIAADPWLGQLPTPAERWRDFLEVYLSERPAHEAAAESSSLARVDRLAWLARERQTLRPSIVVENDIVTLSRRLAFWEVMDVAVRDYRYLPHDETLQLFLSGSRSGELSDKLDALNDSTPRNVLNSTLPDERAFVELGREILAWVNRPGF